MCSCPQRPWANAENVANIGECILEERRLTKSMEHEDVRCVGFMMVELW